MPFFPSTTGLESPAFQATNIVLNDGVDLTIPTRGIWVGSGGSLKVTMLGGGTVTFINIVSGSLLPLRVSRVWATGTSCSSLIGLS